MSTQVVPTGSPEQHEVLNNATSAPARYVCFDTFPRKGYSFVRKVRYVNQAVIPQAPRPEELSPGTTPGTTDFERADSRAWFFRTAILSKWFTAAVVVLVIAGMLFGAAL